MEPTWEVLQGRAEVYREAAISLHRLVDQAEERGVDHTTIREMYAVATSFGVLARECAAKANRMLEAKHVYEAA